MKLVVKDMAIATGGVLIATLNQHDAALLDLHPADRIRIARGKIETIVVVDYAKSERAVPRGHIGLFDEVLQKLHATTGDPVDIWMEKKPESINHIKHKLDGRELTSSEIHAIIKDVVDGKLTDIELTYYVAGNYTHGMSMRETVALARAMIDTGDRLKFNRRKLVVDKHCIGGVAGNRTTMAAVPIVAAAGFFIPKTSSRAITSPAGTADTMEVLANVALDIHQIKRVLKKVGACITWGGAVSLAPADDAIINVEHPLSLDPEGQLLASIMAKKGSVGSNYVLIDIPVGKGTKIESRKAALHLKQQFEKTGKALKIKTHVIITEGSEPIGNGIGPALEARDVMWMLKNDPRQPYSLRRKAIRLAAEVFEMTGKCKKGQGEKLAEQLLHSGKAYKKMWDIIIAQGAKIKSTQDIKIGKYMINIMSPKSGVIRHIDNLCISKIARVAGCPKDHGAGIYLYHHVGDAVRRGEKLFTIYAENQERLEYALEVWKEICGVVINSR
ncbi:AMP phosphorylase [Candidatus Woesearchaeota archaeon]|nr:AMP phosphorylase [Candidatus Woesearchaeota archaeon]